MSWPRLLTQTHYRLRLAPSPPTFRIHWWNVVGEPSDDSHLTSRIKPLTKDDNWKMGFGPVAIDNANEKGWAALLNILWVFRAYRDLADIKLPLRRDQFFFITVCVDNALGLVMDLGWGWWGTLMRWLTLWGLMRGWREKAKWLDFCLNEHYSGCLRAM